MPLQRLTTVVGCLLLSGVKLAVAASPMLTITPSTLSLTTRSDGGTSVIYTVTNNMASSTVTNLIVNPAYHSTAAVSSLTLQNDTCSGVSLAPNASCQFGVVIAGANQADSFTVTPSVCNGTQQICSTSTSANVLTVHVDQIRQDPYAYFGAEPAISGYQSVGSIATEMVAINAVTHQYGTPVTGLLLSTGAQRGSIAVALDGSTVYAAEEPTDDTADIAVLSSGPNSQLLKRIRLPNTTQDSSFFLVVSPDGNRLYVSATDFSGSDAVYAINLKTDVVTPLSSYFDQPYALALSPDGSRLFVANYQQDGAGSVSVINTVNYSLVTSLTGGIHHPNGVLLSPDGATLYISNIYDMGDATPSITSYAISAQDVYSQGRYLGSEDTSSMSMSSDGNYLYVSHLYDGDIYRMDLRAPGDLPTQITTGTSGNAGIALTPNELSLFIDALPNIGFSAQPPTVRVPTYLYPGVVSDLNTAPVFTLLNSFSGIRIMNQVGSFVD